MKLSIFVLALIVVLGYAGADEASLNQNLPGHWKEDQYQRKNLNNFLYEVGKCVLYVHMHLQYITIS